jgi:hypothetical protein
VSETRKIAAILVSDVVGYSRLAGAGCAAIRSINDRCAQRARGAPDYHEASRTVDQ